ncbi:MAG: hypothetical protein M0Q88_09630 [Bacilli bacterium]|nr:hypothetical protein [Bacilli bacterium]
MRLPYYINTEEKKEKSFFNFSDITNTLFFNTPPSITVKPFKHLSSFKFKYLSFTFNISLSYKESLLERVSNSIIKFNDCKVNNIQDKILKLSYPLYFLILKEYEKTTNQWIDYYTQIIHEYCEKSEISKLNWSIIKAGLPTSFIKDEPTIEQKIWIRINQLLDKKEIVDYIEAVRESLLPWFNSDLYKEVKKKEENTRININYEQERENMLKNKFNYQIKEEELDIIG